MFETIIKIQYACNYAHSDAVKEQLLSVIEDKKGHFQHTANQEMCWNDNSNASYLACILKWSNKKFGFSL